MPKWHILRCHMQPPLNGINSYTCLQVRLVWTIRKVWWAGNPSPRDGHTCCGMLSSSQICIHRLVIHWGGEWEPNSYPCSTPWVPFPGVALRVLQKLIAAPSALDTELLTCTSCRSEAAWASTARHQAGVAYYFSHAEVLDNLLACFLNLPSSFSFSVFQLFFLIFF